MKQDDMSAWQESSLFFGGSSAYLEDMFELYLKDPNSVSAEWRSTFDNLPKKNGNNDVSHEAIKKHFKEIARSHTTQVVSSGDVDQVRRQTRVMDLINCYRSSGHLKSNLDPIGNYERPEVPSLNLSYHDLTTDDLSRQFNTGSLIAPENASLQSIIKGLEKTYCGNIGIEYLHITNTEETTWIREKFETNQSTPNYSVAEKTHILKLLTAAEGLEKYLHTKYVGQKRFSLEGGDSLIPLLDDIVQNAGRNSVNEVVIGMAHRGRLNVLVNLLGKSPADLFQEFEGKYIVSALSGDVKYHKGFSSDVATDGGPLHLTLAFNPSHLEIIDPVVEGSVRARQERRGDTERLKVLPILIHGDAAFAGQGVVMETFNLSQIRGFMTGGTVHIVINNQIGFTTSNPLDSRSTLYCTDVAKMVQAPIFHVNGDDPEAVIFVAKIALEYRMKFKKDVVIDMVCYRRHGHNEADEPMMTQPIMYGKIKKHPTTRSIYAEKLITEKVITSDEDKNIVNGYRDILDAGNSVVTTVDNPDKFAVDWAPYTCDDWRASVVTSVKLEDIKRVGEKLCFHPADFTLQKQVQKEYDSRKQMLTGEQPINWGFAETLAYGTLVDQGVAVRLVGQDAQRGTFTHRQAMLHDANNGEMYFPLKHISDNQAPISIIDSTLSEEAVLGYEYGYATASPESLVIWEAQFGDFANGAQVVIDQFISSGEQKWGRLCGLVLLLPHGYEGQGPEHSSARLERYLQLCAQSNMQVCVPSTPAQAFHMLRRQIIRNYRKPLIVMSPKSLLRHKLATSSLDDLTQGQFHVVIPEVDELKNEKIDRIVLCSGKVYYELLQKRRDENKENVAIIRIEQQYPFPEKEVIMELKKYQHAKTIIWCQEEPENQGAWFFIQSNINNCLQKGQVLSYAGRSFLAAPAAGSPKIHLEKQLALVEDAIGK